jgi:hypothetical protein
VAEEQTLLSTLSVIDIYDAWEKYAQKQLTIHSCQIADRLQLKVMIILLYTGETNHSSMNATDDNQ